jgi:hypothetical protein
MHGNTKTAHPNLRGVQCVRRRLSDGTVRQHYYYRPTGAALPAPDHPEFQKAYEAAKRDIAQVRGTQSGASDQSQATPSNREPVPDEVVDERKPHVYLTPEEVSLRWRRKVDAETLANWRSAKMGPPYSKFGRAVLYRFDLLEKWEEQNLVVFEL